MKTLDFFSVLCLTITLLFIIGCKNPGPNVKPYNHISGQTMGTKYNITADTDLASVKVSIDSILNVFEDELSTYRPHSLISTFNKDSVGICIDNNSYFYKAFLASLELHQLSNAFYDPSIAPLVNFWGFGPSSEKKRASENRATIKQLLELIGLNTIQYNSKNDSTCITKNDPHQAFDFNASAKGLGVDVVADYLQSMGVMNYLVEIGGEIRAKGKNSKNKTWTLGINKPSPSSGINDIVLPVRVQDMGMATSGNYRNFYIDGRLTYAHIINPKSGLSQPTDILSATVIAKTCETADGLATALMSMGLEKAKETMNKWNSIDACLIIKNNQTDSLEFIFSKDFEKRISK